MLSLHNRRSSIALAVAALTVAEGTAANHVFRLINRLGVHNRAQISAWAVEHRLHE